MKIINTKFEGLKIVQQDKYKDRRGYLRVSYIQKLIKKKFVFDYCTTSKGNVLRGFHLQTKFTQSKYVNVIKGKILDVVIDLRKNSKTFGKVFKIVLSDKNAISLYIPKGFAHAYYSYAKENIIYYKLDDFYAPKYEYGIIYNDKSLNIKWPNKKMIVSKKDKNLLTFKEFKKKFKGI